MTKDNNYDVVIIGGSYAGLSAAMSLGRALRRVLVIDSGKPCNAPAPHSHNFLTQDGVPPRDIAALGREQVRRYDTVAFYSGRAVGAQRTDSGFTIETEGGDRFGARKLVLATGMKDQLPPLEGFAECWGVSIIHCPYCHGYEVKGERTGILGNGEYGYEFARMIHNWTEDLVLYTNGKCTLTEEQVGKLGEHGIPIVEEEVERFEHSHGQIEHIVFKTGGRAAVRALYARPDMAQHSDLPAALGCELTETGHIKVDGFQKTTVPGVFACGDNTILFRAVSGAVASGTMAGAACNRELIEEAF